MIRTPRTPGRLVLLGAVLLWVVSPLSLGGLITVAVRAHEGAGIGAGLGVLLVVWCALAALILLAGFGALVAGVLLWWRGRDSGGVAEFGHAEEIDASGVNLVEERLGR